MPEIVPDTTDIRGEYRYTRNRVAPRGYLGGGDPLHFFDRLDDGAELTGELRNLIVGQGNGRKHRQMSHGLGRDFRYAAPSKV